MLKEIEPSPFRELFSLEIASSTVDYSKRSYSLKKQDNFIYVCLKTMPLKFSIVMFQSKCLSNVRSFTLKTSNTKQITFLNLETQNGSSPEKQAYQIFVGYQTGEFDIYSIMGDNAKLIQASQETSINKQEFLEVVYQQNCNQILIINKNVLTSIEKKHPFRLIRQQQIQSCTCCQLVGQHIVTGGHTNINVYQTANFNKLKTIPIGCLTIKSTQNNQFYIGTSDPSFCWISADGNVKNHFQGTKSSILHIFKQQGEVWVFNAEGGVTCFKQEQSKATQKQVKDSKLKDSKLKELSSEKSDEAEQNNRNEEFEKNKSNQIELISRNYQPQNNGEPDSSVRQDSQQRTIISSLKTQFQEKDKVVDFAHFHKVVQNGILSVKMFSDFVLILDQKGILSVKQVVKQTQN